MGNGDLKERMATQGAVAQAAQQSGAEIVEAKPVSRVDELRGMIDKMMPEIQKAMPKMGLTPERLGRLMVTALRTTPDLAACSTQSIMGALMMSATLGLEPGTLGLCYILPFNNRRQIWDDQQQKNVWATVKEAEFVIGYKGEIELARRSGQIMRIAAQVVFEKDQFDLTDGLHADLVHKRFLGGDRGEPIGAYMVAQYTNGGFHFDYMTRAEIEAHRDQYAKGFLKDGKPNPNSPWVKDWQDMWCKTPIRKNFKWLPVSTELALMAAQDETVKRIEVGAKADEIQMLLNNPDEAAPALPEAVPQEIVQEPVAQEPLTVADVTVLNDRADVDKIMEAVADADHVCVGEPPVFPGEKPQDAPEPKKTAKASTTAKKAEKKAEPPADDIPRHYKCRECHFVGHLSDDVTEAEASLMDCGGCAQPLKLCADFRTEPFPDQSVMSVD